MASSRLAEATPGCAAGCAAVAVLPAPGSATRPASLRLGLGLGLGLGFGLGLGLGLGLTLTLTLTLTCVTQALDLREELRGLEQQPVPVQLPHLRDRRWQGAGLQAPLAT